MTRILKMPIISITQTNFSFRLYLAWGTHCAQARCEAGYTSTNQCAHVHGP